MAKVKDEEIKTPKGTLDNTFEENTQEAEAPKGTIDTIPESEKTEVKENPLASKVDAGAAERLNDVAQGVKAEAQTEAKPVINDKLPDPEEKTTTAAEDMEKANAEYARGLADMVEQYKADTDSAVAEEKAIREAEAKAAPWAAATELASGIANLIGTFHGASNQSQSGTEFSSWMQKADQDSKDRRKRIDALRTAQRSAQLAGLKQRIEGQQAAAKLKSADETRKTNAELAAYKLAYQAKKDELNRENNTQNAIIRANGYSQSRKSGQTTEEKRQAYVARMMSNKEISDSQRGELFEKFMKEAERLYK